jgi:hypothetical protein
MPVRQRPARCSRPPCGASGAAVGLNAESSSVAPRRLEAAPIRYVAELAANTDSERAIRWLIALMALCCDLPALTVAASATAMRAAA